jgi:hypothetical protein
MSRFSLSFLRYLFSTAGNINQNYGHDHHYSSYGHHGFFNLLITLIKSSAGKLLQHKRLLILILIWLLAVGSIFLVCAAWLVVKLIGIAAPWCGVRPAPWAASKIRHVDVEGIGAGGRSELNGLACVKFRFVSCPRIPF